MAFFCVFCFLLFFFFFVLSSLGNSPGFWKEALLNGLCKLHKWPKSSSESMQQEFIGKKLGAVRKPCLSGDV